MVNKCLRTIRLLLPKIAEPDVEDISCLVSDIVLSDDAPMGDLCSATSPLLTLVLMEVFAELRARATMKLMKR